MSAYERIAAALEAGNAFAVAFQPAALEVSP